MTITKKPCCNCLTIMIIRLTTGCVLCDYEDVFLVDMNGYKHQMSLGFVYNVIILAWVSLLLALLFNCIYYSAHPMALKISPMKKLRTYICGEVWNLKLCKMEVKKPSTNDIELKTIMRTEAEEKEPLKCDP